MSGGSSDDAVLAISHSDGKKWILDLVQKQIGSPPFNPRRTIEQFCDVLDAWKIHKVVGDSYGGLTFRQDFQARGKIYDVCDMTASENYEQLEPALNANEVELLDASTLVEQLCTLVWRGSKITHENGAHDDFANAAAIAINLARVKPMAVFTPHMLDQIAAAGRFGAMRAGLSASNPFQLGERAQAQLVAAHRTRMARI